MEAVISLLPRAMALQPRQQSRRWMDTVQLEMVPHCDFVSLQDFPDVCQIFAHRLAHERLLLPQDRRWSLLFDDQGFGFVVADEGGGGAAHNPRGCQQEGPVRTR